MKGIGLAESPFSEEDRTRVLNILQANKRKPFARRMLEMAQSSDFPRISRHPNTGSDMSTHLMSTASGDGKGFLFPMIQESGPGVLHEFGQDQWKEALDNAFKSDNVMEFDSEEEARWFEGKWKSALGLAK